jgi:hypothetical protein
MKESQVSKSFSERFVYLIYSCLYSTVPLLMKLNNWQFESLSLREHQGVHGHGCTYVLPHL